MLVLALLIAAAPEGGWKKIGESDGVVVEARAAPNGATMIRGTGEINLPIERVKEALLDLEKYRDWIPSLSVWDITKKSDSEVHAYGRHDLPWPMDDRDYNVRYRWKSQPDGSFIIEAKSVPEGPAPIDGVIRLRRVHSLWKLVPIRSDVTQVSYTYNGDLGGKVPDAVKQSAWKSEPPDLIHGLRKQVEKRSKR